MSLKLALRHLSKNRGYAAINIFGLAIGICAALLIFRLVHYELSFDAFQPNYERIVRIVTNDQSETEGESFTPGIPLPAMDVMQQSVTQFTLFARLHGMWPTITVPDPSGGTSGRKFATDDLHESSVFADPAFFSIFEWNWLAGDAQSALTEPYTIVLTKKLAEKCFGTWQLAVGKTVILDGGGTPLTVRGIVDNPPTNSDFQFNLIVSYSTLKAENERQGNKPEWGSTSSNDQAFALLTDGSQFQAANASLAQVGQQEHYKSHKGSRVHVLQPLSEIHYDERYSGAFGTHLTEKSRLWVLGFIGALVLLMACFNFVNLATAQAAQRSREVGVRKSLGGRRSQLVGQFMGETFVIVGFAVLLGMVFAVLCKPLLHFVSDVPDSQAFLSDPMVLGFLGVTMIVVSLFSGFYPALVLSGFEPVKALKNSITSRTVGGVSLRKILVVSQFVIAQALIIGTLVTVSQMDFLRKMDLGFKPDLVYVLQGISTDSSSVARFEGFKNQLKEIAGVGMLSFSSDVPSSGNNWSSNFAMGTKDDAPFNTYMKIVDADFFKTYNLRMLAGRPLEPSDTMREVVVNQTLIKKLGIQNPEEAIGKEFRLGGQKSRPVVGVVADFTANSAHEEMKQMALFSSKGEYSTVGIKIHPENMNATTAKIQQIFEQRFPEQIFNGQFMDEKIAEFYRDEQRFAAMCKGFAGLAILISCLGLYGLATLMAAQRTKEIGVRKVLGASVGSVVGLLSKDFLLLVLAAAVVAVPLAWYAMNAWLQDFVYRTPLSWWLFAGTVGLALAVALLTVGLRAWSSARANPVQSLRSE